MNAPIRNPQGMRDAVRDGIEEREIPCGNVDEIVGRAEGYTNKLISDQSGKNFSIYSLFDTLGAIGKCVVVLDDPDQIQKVAKRWTKRKRIQSKEAALAYRFSIDQKMQEAADFQAQLQLRERMKTLGKLGGKKGGKRRLKTMGKRARQRAASHAARMRWSKRDDHNGST